MTVRFFIPNNFGQHDCMDAWMHASIHASMQSCSHSLQKPLGIKNGYSFK